MLATRRKTIVHEEVQSPVVVFEKIVQRKGRKAVVKVPTTTVSNGADLGRVLDEIGELQRALIEDRVQPHEAVTQIVEKMEAVVQFQMSRGKRETAFTEFVDPLYDWAHYYLAQRDLEAGCSGPKSELIQRARKTMWDYYTRYEYLKDQPDESQAVGEIAEDVVPRTGTEIASMWQQLESPPAGSTLVREFSWPARSIEYTITERVRNSVPHDMWTFESDDGRARQLRALRGSGFEYAWRSAQETLLSPTWLTLESAAIDLDSGRVVASGHLTHEVWDLPPAHDLGAIGMPLQYGSGHPTGLLMPAQSLYVGSIRTGAMAPLDSTVNVKSVDLLGGTGLIAALEFLGSSAGAVSIYDSMGTRRLLTVLDYDSSLGSIRFSGNGQWLLVTKGDQSTLVEVSTGRWLHLDLGNAAWWPMEDSTLLTITQEDGKEIPRLFSLASDSYAHVFPAIVLDAPHVPDHPHMSHPAVSPDGRELLALTPAGAARDYPNKDGVGGHLARVNLTDGQGRLASEVFFDADQTMESDIREVRWTARQPVREIHLHPDLEARLNPPVTQHEWLDPARWADEAERILLLSMNKAIHLSKEDRDFSHLVPEIVSALVPVSHDSGIWERRSEWLTGLQENVTGAIEWGEITGSEATAWLHICTALAAIQSGRPDLVDSISAVWA
jgi:hypothetical protein